MHSTFVKNFITKRQNNFFCTVCDVENTSQKFISNHIASEKHLELVKTWPLPDDLPLDEQVNFEIISNGMVLDKTKQYKCTLCSCQVNKIGHVITHINGKRHMAKLKQLALVNEEYDFINSVDKCKKKENNIFNGASTSPVNITNQSCSLRNSESFTSYEQTKSCGTKILTQHQNVKKTVFNHNFKESQNEINEKFLNSDAKHLSNSSIICSICQNILKSDAALLYHRMFHLSQRNPNITDIILFDIIEDSKRIHCSICNYVMNNEEELHGHLKDIIHQKRFAILTCLDMTTSMNLMSINNATLLNIMYTNSLMPPNIPMIPNTNSIYDAYYCCNMYYNDYSVAMQNNFMNSSMNQHEMFNTNHSLEQYPQIVQSNVNDIAYFCFLCNMSFTSENSLYIHNYYDNVHKSKMYSINLLMNDKYIQFKIDSDFEGIKCLKCQVLLVNVNFAINHIFQEQHLMHETNEAQKHLTAVNNYNIVHQINYNCPVCNYHTNHDYQMVQHLESNDHKIKSQNYYCNVNCDSYKKIIFHCQRCEMNFFNDKNLLDHFYQYHGNLPRQRTYGNNIQQNNEKINFGCPHCQTICTNDATLSNHLLLCHSIDTKLDNKTEQSEKSHQVKRYTTAVNRSKNLMKFNSRYVKLCGETGDGSIFKVNKELISRLKLGLNLTYPYEQKRGCIPCGIEVSSSLQCLYEHLRSDDHEKNLQEMEENDEDFEDYPDQFSDLKLAKSYMYEYSDKFIKCLACGILIQDQDDDIRNHMQSESHNVNCETWKESSDEIFNIFDNIFQNLWYYIDKYFCNICCAQFEFDVDYARHLESSLHIKEVERKILKNQSLSFDCCIICASYWYAKSDHHYYHCNRYSHKYILKSRDFTVPEMNNDAKSLLNSVNQSINEFIKQSDEVLSAEKHIENMILKSIELVVKSKYPNAKAHLFGSRISYLSFPGSDLDVYLDCENQSDQLISVDECVEQIKIVQECFHKHQDLWAIEEIILKARVPIIRLRHRSTSLNCDLSFINGLSVEKSKILSVFVKACEPCRKMILYLKKWSILCKTAGRYGITTFALSWLVIFYLQTQKILPSVWDLIQLENSSKLVAGWETGVFTNISVDNPKIPIKDLLVGFFEFYSKFDYISNVACPYLGKTMKKSDFSEIDELPEEMNNYKTKSKEEDTEIFRFDSPMCIQEPIDLSQNMTKAVTKLHLRMFKQYCAESVEILKNIEEK
ncbi:uncharacterized protein LOC106648094 [Trichogramma pretiosum]|uniref:uncharacterized protein LOC106648094 n=1 Tax=Trichogramma pretiosum TaxID=7493 RepID=UPI0006C9464B|nr:uncharacterized protein LOC106648094 [Trichogramma pretiosum]